MDEPAFSEISVQRGNLEAIWEYIGEGWSGEFDPDDPDDVPLLRFTVYQDGEQMEDMSYCTQMPVSTDEGILRRALELILDATEEPSPKRALEELSWMKPDDFQPGGMIRRST